MATLRDEGRILAGPFAGMKYGHDAVGSYWAPKILGTYECELRPVLNRLQRLPFCRILDVGAAEGYYAVGSALLWPTARVIAFETTDQGRSLLTENAQLNKVSSRLAVFGHCELPDLTHHLPGPGPTLLIMDAEGAEQKLIDPLALPCLSNTHLLVEVHDCFIPGLGELLRARLSDTHTIEEIWTRPRRWSDFSAVSPLRRAFLWRYLTQFAHEGRPGPMRWFMAWPRNSHS